MRSSGTMSLLDPSKVGGERVSKTPFTRPEVGSYLRFFRAPGRLLGGWEVWLVTSCRRKDAEGAVGIFQKSERVFMPARPGRGSQ
jgi:hypothetical protein